MNGFHLQPGATVYDTDGAALSLDREIGSGGEGSVWSIRGDQGKAAKFYHKGIATEHAMKLEVMCRLKSASLLKVAAWPVSTLRPSRNGPTEGLLMPRISGYQAAHLLYSPKSRRASFPEAQFPFIVHSTANIARAFAAIHDAGQVIGDVNHGNLLVSEYATVALIDCDSFEVTDHNILYPCLVGVPTYTPPELQGRSFQGVRRTKQHDAFGLAVLIFHMLFLGRHPFAGIYRNGTADMTIEEAITQYRFAYSLDTSSTQMQPPPSAPRLADFPPILSNLFIRAFTRAESNGGRPSAHEWIPPLEALSRNLKQCDANMSHHFSNHLVACPWCRVEGMVGIPMFGIRLVLVGTEQFNISGAWAQIEAVRPISELPAFPTRENFVGSFTVDVRIGEIVRKRRAKRLMSIGAIVAAIGTVAVAQPESILSIAILVSGLYGMTALWRLGNAGAGEFVDSCRAATRDHTAGVQEWDRIKVLPATFTDAKQKLVAARQAFLDLPAVRARKMAELNATRRQRQLQHFLESHRIEDAALAGIGRGRKELLRAYNIEDAYDVNMSRISDIKGFGPKMSGTLWEWRQSLERQFRFDPNHAIDRRDILAIEQEINRTRADAIRLLTSGPQTLQDLLNAWYAQQASVREQLNRSAKRLAQAEVDMKALRPWATRLKRYHVGVAGVIFAILILLFAWWLKTASISPPSTVGGVERAGPVWAYPNPERTPGFANPGVTQANIRATICNQAWSTSNVRPPVSYTTGLKKRQMKEWALPGTPADYEEDHFIGLELGGSPTDVRNLWPEPYNPRPGAKEKDVVERYLHRQICEGAMTLEQAQKAIATDWVRVYLDMHR